MQNYDHKGAAGYHAPCIYLPSFVMHAGNKQHANFPNTAAFEAAGLPSRPDYALRCIVPSRRCGNNGERLPPPPPLPSHSPLITVRRILPELNECDAVPVDPMQSGFGRDASVLAGVDVVACARVSVPRAMSEGHTSAPAEAGRYSCPAAWRRRLRDARAGTGEKIHGQTVWGGKVFCVSFFRRVRRSLSGGEREPGLARPRMSLLQECLRLFCCCVGEKRAKALADTVKILLVSSPSCEQQKLR